MAMSGIRGFLPPGMLPQAQTPQSQAGGYGRAGAAAPGAPQMGGRMAVPQSQKVPQPGVNPFARLQAPGGGRSAGPNPFQRLGAQGGGGGGGFAAAFGRPAPAFGAAGQQMPPKFAPGMGGAPGGSPMARAGGMLQQQRPGGFASLLSDRESKTRIRELENELDHTYQALEGQHVEYPTPGPHHLDEGYRKPSTSEYSYKEPGAPGAAPGRHVGPMSDELRGIPGVVSRGPDGMDRVDAPRLTMANTSQIARQRRELDELHSQLEALGEDPDAVLHRAAGGR